MLVFCWLTKSNWILKCCKNPHRSGCATDAFTGRVVETGHTFPEQTQKKVRLYWVIYLHFHTWQIIPIYVHKATLPQISSKNLLCTQKFQASTLRFCNNSSACWSSPLHFLYICLVFMDSKDFEVADIFVLSTSITKHSFPPTTVCTK